jgi:hypothetical protein
MNPRASLAALVALLGIVGGYFVFRTTEYSLRTQVVRVANAEVGSNAAVKYNDGVLVSTVPAKYWCGIFNLWVLHQAGLGKNIKWITGVGFLYHLPKTSDPKPGDTAYFSNNQHHAIVGEVHSNRTVTLINGNGTNGKVSISTIPISSVTAFYSIAPLIEQVLHA